MTYFAMLLLRHAGIVPRGAWSSLGDAHIVLALGGMMLVTGLSVGRVVRPRPAARQLGRAV